MERGERRFCRGGLRLRSVSSCVSAPHPPIAFTSAEAGAPAAVEGTLARGGTTKDRPSSSVAAMWELRKGGEKRGGAREGARRRCVTGECKKGGDE